MSHFQYLDVPGQIIAVFQGSDCRSQVLSGLLKMRSVLELIAF